MADNTPSTGSQPSDTTETKSSLYYDTLMGQQKNDQHLDKDERRFEFERAARNTLCCTALGATTGAVIAGLRRHHVGFYAVSMGFNFTVLGGAYFWLREGLNFYDPRYPRLNSALAGSVSGGMISTAFAGVGKGVQGAMVFGIAGWAIEYLNDRLEAERTGLREEILAKRKLRNASSEEGTKPQSTHRIVDDSTFGNVMATADSLEQCGTREEAKAAREEWLRKNELNLEKYGLSTKPFDPTKYDNFWSRFTYASDDEIRVWKNSSEIARHLLTDPIIMNRHTNGDEGWIRTVRARELVKKVSKNNQQNRSVTNDKEITPEEVAAALEPEHVKQEAYKYGKTKQAKSFADWIPEWFPVQAYDEEAYEKKLKERLEKIERMLRRDDEYRRVMKEKVKLYDRELYNLRNHPELYGYDTTENSNREKGETVSR